MGKRVLKREGSEEGVIALFHRLIEDGERFVRAEIRMYRAQLFALLRQAQFVILFGVLALMIAQSAIIAMLVGLIMILGQHLGPAWATLIVVGVSFALVGVLVQLALMRVRKITQPSVGAGR